MNKCLVRPSPIFFGTLYIFAYFRDTKTIFIYSIDVHTERHKVVNKSLLLFGAVFMRGDN